MNRFGMKKLSGQAKVLIAVFLGVAAFLSYYFFVYQGFNRQEEELRAQISELRTQIDAEQVKIDSINARKAAIEEGKKLNSEVAPEDNSNTEWAVLSGYLKLYASNFNLSFADPPKSETYARRSVSVNFVAENLEKARAAIDSIADCPYRNIITRMTLNAQQADGGLGGNGAVSCSFTVTFIESKI